MKVTGSLCAPRTRRPGNAPVASPLRVTGDAGNDGRVVTVGALDQAAAAGGKVVDHLRRADLQPVIVDHVQIGFVTVRHQPAIMQPDRHAPNRG